MAKINRRKFKGNLEDFNYDLKLLQVNNYQFRSERYGSSARIYIGESLWIYSNTTDREILQMCSRVSQNVRAHMRKHEVIQCATKKVVHYNMKSIVENIGGYASGYDIDACYWNIAHQFGYISDKTYAYGVGADLLESDLTPNELHEKMVGRKIARLIAIGSLAKRKRIDRYEDGKKAETVMTRAKTSIIWDNILFRVWEMYEALRIMLGRDFYMWLTDCAYFHPSRVREVKKFFDQQGMSVKPDKIQMREIDGSRLICESFTKNKIKKINIPLSGYSETKSIK